MARFDERATQPARGPRDMLRWKFGKKEPKDRAIDSVRPLHVAGGADAIASGAPVACWIGHASWAFRLGGTLAVIDPIFGAIGGVVRRLVPAGLAASELAPDVVMVTHDHRDHMDLPSLRALGSAPTYVVPLGNRSRVDFAPNVIELDWWESTKIGALDITLVPARHWSMRAPWNRNDTLWGGFVVRGPEGTVYHSGDTAWGDHFAEIGARCGAIDWAMLPIGGYAPRWFMEPQHVDPDEAGRAFLALGAKRLLAMHWGTFRLTDEPVGEPPARLRAFWRAHELDDDRLWILDAGEARPLSG
ncbi:MAG TPA: MBL fold metallo-hydrolase [Kofleriaceae bacterium]|nr:MBL fold metallo-hydrolase [Kofleriaceae bacterium]